MSHQRFRNYAVAITLASALLLFPLGASARHNPDLHSQNMHLKASSPNPTSVNSDLAFWGDLAFAGSFAGFRILDVSDPDNPIVLANVACRGPQNDVSVWANLLFLSIDRPQTTETCDSVNTPGNTPGFEGIRIFDVADPANPRFVRAVATDCGSHTNTLIPDLANNRVLLYISSLPSPAASLGPTPFGTECRRLNPDGSQGHSKISIVEVPLNHPESARVIAEPTFELTDFFGVPGLRGCHDIGVFIAIGLAAAACFSEGQIWDISDPVNPRPLRRIFNSDIQIWHSGAFTYDGQVAIFGDEAGGGGEARCRAVDPATVGAIWFYKTADPTAPLGSFKIPRIQNSFCTAHIYNLIPVRGRYVLVSSWYDGGTSVVDFSNPAAAKEIGFYDAVFPVGADTWSSYWYNNFIYDNDIARGFNIYLFSDRARASAARFGHLNPQTQEEMNP